IEGAAPQTPPAASCRALLPPAETTASMTPEDPSKKRPNVARHENSAPADADDPSAAPAPVRSPPIVFSSTPAGSPRPSRSATLAARRQNRRIGSAAGEVEKVFLARTLG